MLSLYRRAECAHRLRLLPGNLDRMRLARRRHGDFRIIAGNEKFDAGKSDGDLIGGEGDFFTGLINRRDGDITAFNGIHDTFPNRAFQIFRHLIFE